MLKKKQPLKEMGEAFEHVENLLLVVYARDLLHYSVQMLQRTKGRAPDETAQLCQAHQLRFTPRHGSY